MKNYAEAALNVATEIDEEISRLESLPDSGKDVSSTGSSKSAGTAASRAADPPDADREEAEEAPEDPSAIEIALNGKIDEMEAAVDAIPPLDSGKHLEKFKPLLQALETANAPLKADQTTLAAAIQAAHEFANKVQPQVDAFLEEGKRLESGTIESIKAKIDAFLRKSDTTTDAASDVISLTKAIGAAEDALEAVGAESQKLNNDAQIATNALLDQCKLAHPSFAEHTGALRALDFNRAINASALDVARKAVNGRGAALKGIANAGIARMEKIYKSVSELQEKAEVAAGYLEQSFRGCVDSPPQVEHISVIWRARNIGHVLRKNKGELEKKADWARNEKEKIAGLSAEEIQKKDGEAQSRDQNVYTHMESALGAFVKYRIKMVESKQVATEEAKIMYTAAKDAMQKAYDGMEDPAFEMSSLTVGKSEEDVETFKTRFDLMATFLRAFRRLKELDDIEDEDEVDDVELTALKSQMYYSVACLETEKESVLLYGRRVYDTASECGEEFKKVLTHFQTLSSDGGEAADSLKIIESAARAVANHSDAQKDAYDKGFFTDDSYGQHLGENLPMETRLAPFASLQQLFSKFTFRHALFRARALDLKRTMESRKKYEDRAEKCMTWIRKSIEAMLTTEYCQSDYFGVYRYLSEHRFLLAHTSVTVFRSQLALDEVRRRLGKTGEEMTRLETSQKSWGSLTDPGIAISITPRMLSYPTSVMEQKERGLLAAIATQKTHGAGLEQLCKFFEEALDVANFYISQDVEKRNEDLGKLLEKVSEASNKARNLSTADIGATPDLDEKFDLKEHRILQDAYELLMEPNSARLDQIKSDYKNRLISIENLRREAVQALADADNEDGGDSASGAGRMDPEAEAAKRAAEVSAARELEAAKEKARVAEAKAGKLQGELEAAQAAISRGTAAASVADGSRVALENAQSELKRVQGLLKDADKAKGEAVKKAEEKAEKDLDKLREENKTALREASEKLKKAGEERDKAKNDLAGVQSDKSKADEAVAGLKRDLEAANKATKAAEEKLAKETESSKTAHAAELARVKAEGVTEGEKKSYAAEVARITAELTAAGTPVTGTVSMVLVGEYAANTQTLTGICTALASVDFAANPIDLAVLKNFEDGITVYLGESNTGVDPLLDARMTALKDFVVALMKNTRAAYTQKADLAVSLKAAETARDDFGRDLAVMTGYRNGLSADNLRLTGERDAALRDVTRLTGDLATETSETSRLAGELTTMTGERDTANAQIVILTTHHDDARLYIAKLQAWGRSMQDLAQRQYAVYQKVAEFYGGFYELRPPNQDQQLDGEPE